ncbi:MAG: hypothetical protein ACXVMS_07000 [Flavisolibacter sp.]
MTTWDRAGAVDYFMSQYNRYNPSQYQFRAHAREWSGIFDTERALQKLYLECARAAGEKQTLLLKLEELIRHGAEDQQAHNKAEYNSIIRLEASELKKKIENGQLFE